MYRRPAQCSPLLRAKIDGGWVTARSSAIDGLGERADTPPHLLGPQVEVLEDREAVGPGAGRLRDGERELLVVEAEVAVGARQLVAAQAALHLGHQRRVLAQVRGEQRRHARELAVLRGAGVEVVDRVQDLVVAAGARAAG